MCNCVTLSSLFGTIQSKICNGKQLVKEKDNPNGEHEYVILQGMYVFVGGVWSDQDTPMHDCAHY